MESTNEILTFGELTIDGKLDLIRLSLEGATVEYLFGQWCDDEWVKKTTSPAMFEDLNRYRVVLSKPSIDWTHITDLWQYLAVDDDGESFLYSERPDIHGGLWSTSGECSGAPRCLVSFDKGTCHYKDSLVHRKEC